MPNLDPKDVQAAEAAARDRAQNGPDGSVAADARALNLGALDVTGDDAPGDVTPQRQPPPPDLEADFLPQPVVRSIKDEARDAIARNFRQNRADETDDIADDVAEINALTRHGLPPEFQDQFADADNAPAPQVAIDSDIAAEDGTQPDKFLVKINGEERYLTREEMTEAAQKALAGDDYLGKAKATAKALLEEVNTEIEGRRTAAPVAQHQDDRRNDAQPEAPRVPQPGDEDYVDPFKAAVEKLQFGSPDEAAETLRDLVSNAGRQASQEEIRRDRLTSEHHRSISTLTQFRKDHPEYTDSASEGAMRSLLLDLQREDLVKAGFTNIPTDETKIFQKHLEFRALGGNVRSVPALLVEAKTAFDKRFGVAPSAKDPVTPVPAQRQQPSAQPAKIAVEVNRTARREAIVQQPTRSVTPRQPAAAPQPADRSTVVANMRNARMGPRGGANVPA